MSNGAADADLRLEVDGDPFVGRILAGKYRIEGRLGAGSMGAIYRARHLTLDKMVCVKIMLDDLARDPSLAQRFEREARAASRLSHPSSVLVLDYGKEDDGTLYIVMELIEGRDLYAMLGEGPFADERIIDIMTQTLSALAAAHDAGILHRDLKPENIMITSVRADDGGVQERVKVCDFGIAHMAEPAMTDGRRITSKGFIVGTPEYMAPEQARAEAPDPRSDLYSVGVILFQLLTGRLPFEADSAVGVALKQLSEDPPRPRDLNPAVHPALEAICLRAMRKLPSERYASARDMRSALRSALFAYRALSQTDERETLPDAFDASEHAGRDSEPLALQLIKPRRSRRRSRLLASAFALGTFAVVGIGSVGVVQGHPLRARPFEMANAAAAFFGPRAHASLLDAPSPTNANATEAAPIPAVVLPAPLAPVAPDAAHLASPVAAPTRLPPVSMASGLRSMPRTTRAAGRAGAASPPPLPTPPAATEQATIDAEVAPAPVPMSAPAPEAVASPSPEGVVALHRETPAAPAPPRYLLASAHVELGPPALLVGATSLSVDRALTPMRAKLDACYREALPRVAVTAAAALDGVGLLHLETDEVGIIHHANVEGALAADVGPCIARAVIGGRVRNVDTGTASADVSLTYRSR